MSRNKPDIPPLFALRFFRWFCHPGLREEIEGDLMECYSRWAQVFGEKKADTLFYREVLFLFRPSVIGSFNHLTFKLFSDMKKSHWIGLIALNLLVALCILLPFLPGPYDKLSLVLSVSAQLTGYIGLLLIPIGALWLIEEMKKLAGNQKAINGWSSGYYYAMASLCIGIFLSLIFALALAVSTGISAGLIVLAGIGFMACRQVPAIKALKYGHQKAFNAVPLYLLSIPLIAFAVGSFFVSPMSDYSRSYAIKQGEGLIAAIENYRSRHGNYPQSINHVRDAPKPSVMGISEFIYELNGEAYNLSFVQHQHFGATREVVMYNKKDEQNVKGHFADYKARQPHWKYFWLD